MNNRKVELQTVPTCDEIQTVRIQAQICSRTVFAQNCLCQNYLCQKTAVHVSPPETNPEALFSSSAKPFLSALCIHACRCQFCFSYLLSFSFLQWRKWCCETQEKAVEESDLHEIRNEHFWFASNQLLYAWELELFLSQNFTSNVKRKRKRVNLNSKETKTTMWFAI